MSMQSSKLTIMKIASKYKIWLLCLLVFWAIGMLITILLMGWNNTKVDMQKSYLSYTHGQNKLPPANTIKMQKISKYCNFPNDFSSAQEGQMKGNFSLAMVSILIRHGDRSPLQPVRNISSINCNVESSYRYPQFTRYLKSMSIYQKKLNREPPFNQFSLTPPDKCTLSHLTQRGAFQHLSLGAELAQIYNGRWKLLNKARVFNQIKVYSTLFSRTYQSCLAFLHGFLPRFDLAKINVTEVNGVHFSMKKEYAVCPLLGKLQSQLGQKRIKTLESHPAVTRLLSYLHPIAIPNYKHAKQSTRSLLDSFMFYVCHGTHLPCLQPPDQHCATFEQVRNVLAFNEWEGKQRVEDPLFIKYCWLQIYGFLVELHSKMEDFINGKLAQRFLLYSGHDVTLEPLLSVLGIADGTNPPYASRLAFELYASTDRRQLQSKHVLRIVYNGKDMTKFVTFCKETENSATKKIVIKPDYCRFEKMTQFVRSTFFKVMGANAFNEACQLEF